MNGSAVKGKSLFICVGDISADMHAAKLIGNLKKAMPELDVWGVGGSHMETAGARLLYNRDSLAVVGLVEVIRYLPKLIAMRSDLLKKIQENKPDAVLLMDFGGFNLNFASLLKSKIKDLPIIYFISPQIWGTRPWRIYAIKKAVTKMLVIFPFEEALYRKNGVSASFVGHPLTLKFKPPDKRKPRAGFFAQNNLDPDKPLIGIFPGSRNQEIKSHAPVIFEAIDWIQKEHPSVQFVISATNSRFVDAILAEMDALGFNHLLNGKVKTLLSEQNEALMTHADLLWAKSGTTTLEATLIGTPMLIFYRASWITLIIFLFLKIIKWVGWPNLLAGTELVPELIQLDCRAEQLVRYTLDWLAVPELRQEISSQLKILRQHLGEGDFTENAALEIFKVLGHHPKEKELITRD